MNYTKTTARIILFFFSFVWVLEVHAFSDAAYTIRLVTGKECNALTLFVAQCRVDLFKGYPYLYEGTVEEGVHSMSAFMEYPHAALAVAYYNNEPVAYITGNSLVAEMERYFKDYLQVFKNYSIDPQDHYYLPDVIVTPAHRGRGLIKHMLEVIEAYACKLGYAYATLATESHATHPLKPAEYRELDPLWSKHGFTKTNLMLSFSWETEQPDGSSKMQDHELSYWLKKLSK
ncbi:MAG: GNAT family N-acetyltransferase [Candidatus Babeliales bacterium]